LPKVSQVDCHPGGTIVVMVHSLMIAGPVTICPAESVSRSN
jgi:hypothetical protein